MSKKLPNMAPPFAKARNQVWRYASLPFEKMSSKQRFWLGFATLSLFTTLLITNPLWNSMPGEAYKEGDIIRESIIAPTDIVVVDEKATEESRQVLSESVKPIFAYEPNRAESEVKNFRSVWNEIQRQANGSNTNAASRNQNASASEFSKMLAGKKLSNNEFELLANIIRDSAGGQIYADESEPLLQSEITLIDRSKASQQSTISLPQSSMTSLSAAQSKIMDRLAELKNFSPAEKNTLYDALVQYVKPSVTYDDAATQKAKNEIAKSIQPIKIELKRGQMVARDGDTATPEVISKIGAIRSYQGTNRQLNRFIGLLILISALYWVAWKFIEHRGVVQRLVLSEERSFALFGFVVLAQTALMSIFFRLAEFTAAQNIKAPLNDSSLWSFAIPFAFSSLLITLLADRRTALFTGLFISLLAGLLAPKSLEFSLYSAISSSVAVYGIGRYRTRQSVTIAGVLVGCISALLAVALIAYMQQPIVLNTILLAICCGLGSGLITSAVTAVFLPICETFFEILTDVKLLELSNADLPVLGQLALRAPGTNQHSHAVGTLSEEACRAVGANGLLARIGALYHDIGKLGAPEHFVENQTGKGNPHDKLKPVQSAKIIISHVTYGIKLAKEIGLPQRIIDFIPQHHGTRTLHYFLRKAQAQSREGEEVEENDFRYPGPKPQFKEAAIMMIADSCEAGARALEQPTPENIRFIVTKIIDAILSDDQLDECDLTLRELTQIRESMIKSLVAIYHSRVEYPGYIPPSNSIQKIIIPSDLDSEERGIKYSNPSDIPLSKGGEIEDEAIDRSSPPSKSEKAMNRSA